MATFRAVDGWTTEDNGTGRGKSATVIAHAEGTDSHTAIKSAFTTWLASADGPENDSRQIDGDTDLVRKSVRCRERETTDQDGTPYYFWECEARYGPEETQE